MFFYILIVNFFIWVRSSKIGSALSRSVPIHFVTPVIRFVSISPKFGMCTARGSIWDIVETKIRTFNCPTTVQMPNLELIEIKWIAVQKSTITVS